MHLKSNLLIRQSFNNRVCDDLSEVILHFLSLEDKLKLESVSKQFQRTIFQKEYELKIDRKLVKNRKIFEALLKKCPKINSIDLLDLSLTIDSEDNSTPDDFFDAIITYCDHLVSIKCDFTSITSETFDKFIQTFGPKLSAITVQNSKSLLLLERSVQSVPLTKLGSINKHFGSLSLADVLKLEPKRLRELTYDDWSDIKLLKTLIDKNQYIKRLSIGGYNYGHKEVISLMSQVSRLKYLIELKIWTNIGLNDNSLSEMMRHLADNCRQLKSIKCHFDINSDNISKVDDLLSVLKRFKRLKRLDLKISYDESLDPNQNQLFSCRAFKGFPHLTHLTIGFPFFYSVNETLLTDIDINLPNLQYLFVQNGLRATEWTVDVLNRLSKLKSIVVFVTNETIGETLKKEIIKKNKRIIDLRIGALNWGPKI